MSQERISDEALMHGYSQGDAGAFETLYRRHNGALYRYILRQCLDRNTADEIYQDVWLRLINARRRYRSSARFATYLYHIAHNRMVDYFRRNSSRQAVTDLPLENDHTLKTAWAVSTPRPEVELARKQEVQTVLELIEQLPSVQREVFLLREEAGMSLQEIAKVTGVGRETAKSRLRYALKALREGLQ
ncbi:MAG TPA: RNA polymerase sigma factor [Gammaproteobacteria bacterium]|nr:RNA polymerase sigma factor [Gammaproteobacteria bacterium]